MELLVASAIGAVITAALLQAFMSANKARATAAASGLLKGAGQGALTRLHQRLHAARHVFDRDAVSATWLSRLPIAPFDASAGALTPGADPADVLLPAIKPTASFNAQQVTGGATVANAAFDGASVGNALFFATVEPKAHIVETASDRVTQVAFGSATTELTAYRLHFYYLGRRALATSDPGVRGGDRYTYQLMHWTSRPYLDHRELKAWQQAIMDHQPASDYTGTAPGAFVGAKLTSLGAYYAGAIDLSTSDAGMASAVPALYTLTPTSGSRDVGADTTSRFATDKFGQAVDFQMAENFAQPMIAFNTTAASGAPPIPAVPVESLDVPAFADDASRFPFGFETMVGGPDDARQVLVRLAMAARTVPGKVWVTETCQEVVHVNEF